jgi:hypothetical protein
MKLETDFLAVGIKHNAIKLYDLRINRSVIQRLTVRGSLRQFFFKVTAEQTVVTAELVELKLRRNS